MSAVADQGRSIRVVVYRNQQPEARFLLNPPFDVGRYDPDSQDDEPVSVNTTVTPHRLVIARRDETTISRRWFRVETDQRQSLVLQNLNEHFPIRLGSGEKIRAHQSSSFDAEQLVDCGSGIAIRLGWEVVASEDAYRTLSRRTIGPSAKPDSVATVSIGHFPDSDADRVNEMLKVALDVVREATGSDGFFEASARAAVNMVNLDRTLVLMESSEFAGEHVAGELVTRNYRCVARARGHRAPPEYDVSDNLLTRVEQSCQTTLFHHSSTSPVGAGGALDAAGDIPSLEEVQCTVASPILDPNGKLLGVLYGDRRLDRSAENQSGPISDLEATLFDLLATTIASGINRSDLERRQNLFTEFFSPQVAKRLARDPDLMSGRDEEVSLLFCDIRGFSTVTEKLGPRRAIEWINDVMSTLSQCVIDRDGVLVDYVGDELFAMWGAPEKQADHAHRAIETSRAMLRAIEVLRRRWDDILPSRFGAGIGMNTGMARVGNVGSRQKFKYGPLGNAVNVAARLQSATKQIGVPCIASEVTVRACGDADQFRRLAKLAVVGIEEPITVYEVTDAPKSEWFELRKRYEAALAAFENGQFETAAKTLGAILPEFPSDRPTRRLLARSVEELDQPSNDFDGVWHLTAK